MNLVLLLSVAGLLLSQEKPVEAPKPLDPASSLAAQWNAANQRAESQDTEIKDMALRLQSMHIQLRDTKLLMKELEVKLTALLCEKGTILVMGAPPKCEALKEK